MFRKSVFFKVGLFLALFTALSVMLIGCSEESVNTSIETDMEDAEADIEETGRNTGQVENDDTGTDPEENSQETSEEASENTSEEISEDNIPADTLPAHVVRVVDGDTFEANINGKEETVRLILVDTPETVHPSKPVQPFGPEASEFAKETLEGQEVKLELDVSERDQYGRVLAYVWIGNKIFNEMLLKKGLARVAVYPPDVKYVDRFREVQREAQEKRIGIWSIEDYVTEDGYNERPENQGNTSANTSSNCVDPQIKGNINSKGEKIYHVPGGQFYDVTKPEEMFCTEEEAQAAGYRKSKR